MGNSTLFPSNDWQGLSCSVFLLGISILSFCISHRLTSDNFPKWSSFIQRWPRFVVCLMFIDSWLFIFISGLFIFGIGLERSEGSCTTAWWFDLFTYGLSKFLTYIFLAERVYIVWGNGRARIQTPAFYLSMLVVLLYLIPIVSIILTRVSDIRENGHCYTGMNRVSAFVLLSYDLLNNIFLTCLFLFPIIRSHIANPRLRRMTIRTFFACLVGLSGATANVGIFSAFNGVEMTWMCLTTCVLDITINALALFWVTLPQTDDDTAEQASLRLKTVGNSMQTQPLQISVSTVYDFETEQRSEDRERMKVNR